MAGMSMHEMMSRYTEREREREGETERMCV